MEFVMKSATSRQYVARMAAANMYMTWWTARSRARRIRQRRKRNYGIRKTEETE